jgi:DNA-directed RNA polymerase subunit beta
VKRVLALKTRKRVRLNKEENRDYLDPPSLVDIQIQSFENFIKNGLKEEFANISPIVAYGGKYELEFLENYYFDKPEYSFEECQIREMSYTASLRVPVRLTDKESGEITEQEVFMSDIPIMSEYGTFLVNGSERDR